MTDDRRDQASVPGFSEHNSVRSPKGGWYRGEDFCNSGPKGTDIRWTSACITMDEELLSCELGDRVVTEIVGMAIDGWDALMDAIAAEYFAREEARP